VLLFYRDSVPCVMILKRSIGSGHVTMTAVCM
jgi:hypothetical protein